jgi:hypothetical protein
MASSANDRVYNSGSRKVDGTDRGDGEKIHTPMWALRTDVVHPKRVAR